MRACGVVRPEERQEAIGTNRYIVADLGEAADNHVRVTGLSICWRSDGWLVPRYLTIRQGLPKLLDARVRNACTIEV